MEVFFTYKGQNYKNGEMRTKKICVRGGLYILYNIGIGIAYGYSTQSIQWIHMQVLKYYVLGANCYFPCNDSFLY